MIVKKKRDDFIIITLFGRQSGIRTHMPVKENAFRVRQGCWKLREVIGTYKKLKELRRRVKSLILWAF